MVICLHTNQHTALYQTNKTINKKKWKQSLAVLDPLETYI